MDKINEKALFGLSIIILLIASVIAFNSSFIWMINPPQSKPNYGTMTLTPNYYTQSDPSIPMFQIKQSVIESGSKPGTFYTPTSVQYANITLITNDLPSIPFNISTQDELLGFTVGMYFGLYKEDYQGSLQLLHLQNETVLLNGTLASYNKIFTWSLNQNNGLFYTGEHKINLFVASAIVTQDQFRSHINQSIYYYSSVMESAGFLQYHHTPTRQIVVDGVGIPGPSKVPSFSYVNWGNFNYVVAVTVLVAVAIVIPANFIVKKKFFTKLKSLLFK